MSITNVGINNSTTYTTNTTASANTNSQNSINLDEILRRLVQGDMTALNDLAENNIGYIKKGNDDDFVVTFYINDEKYEVHCFGVNENTNNETPLANNNTEENLSTNEEVYYAPPVNSPPVNQNNNDNPTFTPPSIDNGVNTGVNNGVNPGVNNEVNNVDANEAVNDVSNTAPTIVGNSVEALVYKHTTKITDKLMNIDSFMNLKGKNNMKELGLFLAKRFDEYVNFILDSQGAIIKYNNGTMTQESFESYIEYAISLALQEPYIAIAMQDNKTEKTFENKEDLANHLIDKYMADFKEKFTVSNEWQEFGKFNVDDVVKIFNEEFLELLNNSNALNKFLNNEITQDEFEEILNQIQYDARTCYDLRWLYVDYMYADDSLTSIVPPLEKVLAEMNSRTNSQNYSMENIQDYVSQINQSANEAFNQIVEETSTQETSQSSQISEFEKQKRREICDLLIDNQVSEGYDRIRYNLDLVSYAEGGEKAQAIADKYKNKVIEILETSGVIDKFLNGYITQDEFENYIASAVAIAKTSDEEIVNALYTNPELTEDEITEADRRIHQYLNNLNAHDGRGMFYNPRIYAVIEGDGSDYDDLA